MRDIKLVPRLNKANNQISFQLKRSSLSKEFNAKLPTLKSLKLNMKNFEFD